MRFAARALYPFDGRTKGDGRAGALIWTIPNDKEWTLLINKETGQFHLNYNASLDFGRTKMKLKMLSAPVETFRVDLRAEGGNKGTLALIWKNTEASVAFTVLQ